jgi:hypothetical protein
VVAASEAPDSVAVDSITDSEVTDSAVVEEVDLVGATDTGDGHTAIVIGTMDSTVVLRIAIMMLTGITYVPMISATVITNFSRQVRDFFGGLFFCCGQALIFAFWPRDR